MDNEQNSKLLVSYSFIAALSENNTDLYKSVFIPIFKRALCHYINTNKTFGKDTDIQNTIIEVYGLNIPLKIIRQLLTATINDISRKTREETGFSVFQDGKSFQCNKFPYNELEVKYEEGERNANALEFAF